MPSIEVRIAALESATGKLCPVCEIEREIRPSRGIEPLDRPYPHPAGWTFADELQALGPATRQTAP